MKLQVCCNLLLCFPAKVTEVNTACFALCPSALIVLNHLNELGGCFDQKQEWFVVSVLDNDIGFLIYVQVNLN